jgi:hypothetical protein
MVPYKEFLELWKLKYGPKKPSGKAPVPFAVESAAYEGRVSSGIASFKVTMEIEVFEEGWQRIPLTFKSVAFEEVLVDGNPGVLMPTKAGYEIIWRGKGRHKVEARFVAGVSKGKEYATTEFGLPSVPLHRLEFTVPGKDTEIQISPARAHTVQTVGDETKVLAFLGPQSKVKLTWRYQPELKEREPPLIFANDLLDLSVEERIVRGSATFNLEILRTPTAEFRIKIPEGVQVLDVAGSNMKTWSFADEKRTVLRVTLHKEAHGKYALRVGFEGPAKVPGTLSIPAFSVEGAAGERGFVRVSSAEGVGLRVGTTENIFQNDLRTLPKEIRGGDRALGFRFPAIPYALTLETEQIAPRVTLTTRARLEVERKRIKFNTSLNFLVERAGIFGLRIEVPEGIVLTRVGTPRLVDAWRESEEDGKRILTVDLKGRRMGTFSLSISAVGPVDLDKGELRVPLLKVQKVDREEGTLGVFMDPAIKAAATTTGVVPLEPSELVSEDKYRPSVKTLPLSFAWRWRGRSAAVDFSVERRKPKVNCDVRYEIQGEESRGAMQIQLVYRVQFSGVETFRFRVPKRIVEKLKVKENRKIREHRHEDDPVGDGVATTTYTVKLQGHELGEVVIGLEYDDVFEKSLGTNEKRRVPVPAVVPLDVEHTNTFVAIRKAAALKVDVPSEDYTQIDPSELPASLQTGDVYLALRRFEAPAPFPLDLTKYEYQPVADLVVRHAHLETVVADEGRASTTAYFEILNNDRQFLAVRLPQGSEILELMVDGKPEKPRIGDERILLVPLLTGLGDDVTFQVAIAYTHGIDTSGALAPTTRIQGPELPAMGEAPAPFQALLTWSVHYPSAWKVTSFSGNVNPSGPDAHYGSWLQSVIGRVARFVRPVSEPRVQRDVKPMPPFKNIVPVYTERESVRTVFTNGTGDGVVEISHMSQGARVLTILAAALIAAAAVFAGSKRYKPLWAGGALIVLALLFLSGAGRAWAPVWNGVLVAAVLTAAALTLIEKRRARA